MDAILGCLEDVDLFVRAHNCTFLDTSIKWCGIWYSGDEGRHESERLSGLLIMGHPETGGELKQFL